METIEIIVKHVYRGCWEGSFEPGGSFAPIWASVNAPGTVSADLQSACQAPDVLIGLEEANKALKGLGDRLNLLFVDSREGFCFKVHVPNMDLNFSKDSCVSEAHLVKSHIIGLAEQLLLLNDHFIHFLYVFNLEYHPHGKVSVGMVPLTSLM